VPCNTVITMHHPRNRARAVGVARSSQYHHHHLVTRTNRVAIAATSRCPHRASPAQPPQSVGDVLIRTSNASIQPLLGCTAHSCPPATVARSGELSSIGLLLELLETFGRHAYWAIFSHVNGDVSSKETGNDARLQHGSAPTHRLCSHLPCLAQSTRS